MTMTKWVWIVSLWTGIFKGCVQGFSPEEMDALDDEHRNEQMAVLWCAKEAIYKLTSQYDVDFAKQIKIDSFRFRDEGELSATYIDKDDYEQELDLFYFTFDRHVVVCVSA